MSRSILTFLVRPVLERLESRYAPSADVGVIIAADRAPVDAEGEITNVEGSEGQAVLVDCADDATVLNYEESAEETVWLADDGSWMEDLANNGEVIPGDETLGEPIPVEWTFRDDVASGIGFGGLEHFNLTELDSFPPAEGGEPGGEMDFVPDDPDFLSDTPDLVEGTDSLSPEIFQTFGLPSFGSPQESQADTPTADGNQDPALALALPPTGVSNAANDAADPPEATTRAVADTEHSDYRKPDGLPFKMPASGGNKRVNPVEVVMRDERRLGAEEEAVVEDEV